MFEELFKRLGDIQRAGRRHPGARSVVARALAGAPARRVHPRAPSDARRRRAGRHRRARTRILDAALALMSEQGSAGASMRQLAAACDLNVATIYHYFPSKADLLRSVMAGAPLRRAALAGPATARPLDDAAGPPGRAARLAVGQRARGGGGVAAPRRRGHPRRGRRHRSARRGGRRCSPSRIEAWLVDGFPEHHRATTARSPA